MRGDSMPWGIRQASQQNKPPHSRLPRSMSLKSIPWKTVGLVAVVTLVVIALVKRNFLGLNTLTSPKTPAA
jgi:hypothetical protein